LQQKKRQKDTEAIHDVINKNRWRITNCNIPMSSKEAEREEMKEETHDIEDIEQDELDEEDSEDEGSP
jgi:23S rRNA A1618 N6-methylase RlmF